MPEVLPVHVPSPRCVIGWDGTAYRAFAVDASGHIQTDVLSSALPAGAATAANQTTMITALQLIDDLRNALQSVATDRLRVRGSDQLYSVGSVIAERVVGTVTGSNGYLDIYTCPAGYIAKVTGFAVMNEARALTNMTAAVRRITLNNYFWEDRRAIAIGQYAWYQGEVWLRAGDVLRVYQQGAADLDVTRSGVNGHTMTLEV